MKVLRQVIIAALLAVFVTGVVMGLRSGLKFDADLLSLPGLLAMGPVGALLALRRPGNPIGWLFLCTAALTSCVIWAGVVVDQHGDTPAAWDGEPVVALWFHNFAWFPVIVLCTVMIPLLFPEGWLSARWRRFGIELIAWYSAFLLVASVSPTLELDSGEQVANPFSPTWLPVRSDHLGDILGALGALSLFVGAMAGVLCVGLRYWRGTLEERAQIRWFITAIAFVLVGSVLAGTGGGWASELALGLATAFIPLATWIAITRHGLYEIDRIISRTLAYVLVTGTVIGVYAVLVTSITRLLPVSSALAVTASTLAAAALFQPLLRGVRGVVDRRFNRARYDAQRTVDTFGERLRHEIDSRALSHDLLRVVGSTMQPNRLRLWLKEQP